MTMKGSRQRKALDAGALNLPARGSVPKAGGSCQRVNVTPPARETARHTPGRHAAAAAFECRGNKYYFVTNKKVVKVVINNEDKE